MFTIAKPQTLPPKVLIKYFSFVIRSLAVGFSIHDAHGKFRAPEKYKRKFEHVSRLLKIGTSYAVALSKSRICSDEIVAIIRSGEESSRLFDAIKSVKTAIQEKERTKKEIIKSLLMPTIEFVFGIIAMNGALIGIVPKIKDTVMKLGNVPAFSQMVFNISDFYKAHFLFFLAGYVALGFLIYKERETLKWNVLFRIPFFRNLFQYSFCKRFCFQLKLYLESGMSIIYALKEVEKSVKGYMEKKFMALLIKSVQRGLAFDEAIKRNSVKIIPEDIIDMFLIIKHTGNYIDVISEAVLICEEEEKSLLGRFSSIVEPVIILFMAALVFLLVVAIYYPIFSISSGGIGGR